MTLARKQIAELKENGFVTMPGLLSADEVDALEAATETVIQRPGEEAARHARLHNPGTVGRRLPAGFSANLKPRHR